MPKRTTSRPIYIPKSTYTILETGGGEFISPTTGLFYKGPYIKTSQGYYAGNNPSKLNLKLKRLKQRSKKAPVNNLLETTKTPPYFFANPAVANFIKRTEKVIATKSIPTDKDYKRGYYMRYFAKRNNSLLEYYEIDKETYKSLSRKSKRYDYNLYTTDKIRWALEGDIFKINENSLIDLERKYPNVSALFSKLNEFQKILYTSGKELEYEDGTEYIGYYHLHLGKPMEGSYHRSEPHKTLRYIKQDTLAKKDRLTIPLYNLDGETPFEGTEEFRFGNRPDNYNVPEGVREGVTQVVPSSPSMTPSTTTPNTSTTRRGTSSGGGMSRGGSSGGGGGGY